MMKHFLKSFLLKNKNNIDSKELSTHHIDEILKQSESEGTEKTEIFYVYSVFSNKENRVICERELTYEQEMKLNEINRRNGIFNQDIVFLRK